ncbi:MAG: protein-tyrosine-phosphatase, partial [Phenylobacterium sp.]|nr:protein-tyrosine-phosphatase [Phenylobacterium sp.]
MTVPPPTVPSELQGIFNFRDFGGWPTKDGGAVKRGLLFRSAHHASATPADLERLG